MPVQEIIANKVIVHPLVLLSVVDHFNRMGKTGNQKRVVGVLLGSWKGKGILDVSNSFAGKYFSYYTLTKQNISHIISLKHFCAFSSLR